MSSYEDIEKELKLLDIDISSAENLTIREVTLKYKQIAKMVHPDRVGGNKSDFKEILQAFRTVIEFI